MLNMQFIDTNMGILYDNQEDISCIDFIIRDDMIIFTGEKIMKNLYLIIL